MRSRLRARGCCGVSDRPSCVRRKIFEQLGVHAAKRLGPGGGAAGGGIDLDDRSLAAGVRNLAVAAGAEKAVDATGFADVLDPDVDAHGTGSEEGVEVFDAELADDVELIGIVRDVEMPGAAVCVEPGGGGALDVGREAGVVEHLHGVELVEVDGAEPGEFLIDVHANKIVRTFVSVKGGSQWGQAFVSPI